jgi:hypothetical protein
MSMTRYTELPIKIGGITLNVDVLLCRTCSNMLNLRLCQQ